MRRWRAGSRILPLGIRRRKPVPSSGRSSGSRNRERPFVPVEERREVLVTAGGRYPKDGRLGAVRFFNLQT